MQIIIIITEDLRLISLAKPCGYQQKLFDKVLTKKVVGEEVIIQLLSGHGIKSECLEKGTGLWLDHDKVNACKICTIGVRTSCFVTMHCLAQNANTDLSCFSWMNTYEFIGKGVTSIEKGPIDMDLIKKRVNELYIELFNKKTHA